MALVSWYYENNKSIISTQRAYPRKYGTKTAPDPKTIRNIVKNFEENGSVGDKKRFGPELTVRTPENIEKIRKKLEDSPKRSQRWLSRETKIPKTTIRRIIRDELKLFPYKIHILQTQTHQNKQQRLDYALMLSEKIENNDIITKKGGCIEDIMNN